MNVTRKEKQVSCQGETPFSIDVKGKEKTCQEFMDSYGVRGVVIAGEVHVFPSMKKGEIVEKWLLLMSTQATPEEPYFCWQRWHEN